MTHSRGPGRGDGAPGAAEQARRERFLRQSHIFSTAVRDILEARYLKEVFPQGLTRGQFHLLKLIARQDGHPVRRMAEFLGVSPPAVTQNVDKLERLGLLTRERDPKDRRGIILTVSPLGSEVVHRYESLKTERLAPVLGQIEPEEIETLARLMQRFSVLLFKQEELQDEFCLRCAAYSEDNCPVGHVVGGCPQEKLRLEEGSRPTAEEPAQ
jgi:DNA-binding MarR family transcriptional regulator